MQFDCDLKEPANTLQYRRSPKGALVVVRALLWSTKV